MKTLLWIYAIGGSLYWCQYMAGDEIVRKYAVGGLWLLMMLAPITLGLMVLMQFVMPILERFGFWDE